jgi:uncharacterized phage protein (TIGR02220 family)
MAKRFTDTDKYKKPFHRMLKGAYKLLWDYIYHNCDHAGIWIVDFEIAQLYIGKDMPITLNDAIKYFNDGKERIIEIDNGNKWFVPSFIEFQYGELKENNRVHSSVISILSKNNINPNKLLLSPLQGAKDKDKDKSKDKYISFLEKFNEITGKRFRTINEKLKGQLNARLNDGFTIDEILQATTNCFNSKYHIENTQHLTPEFITRADKLDKYLNTSSNVKKEVTLNDFIVPTADIFGWGDKKCLEMALNGKYPKK